MQHKAQNPVLPNREVLPKKNSNKSDHRSTKHPNEMEQLYLNATKRFGFHKQI